MASISLRARSLARLPVAGTSSGYRGLRLSRYHLRLLLHCRVIPARLQIGSRTLGTAGKSKRGALVSYRPGPLLPLDPTLVLELESPLAPASWSMEVKADRFRPE